MHALCGLNRSDWVRTNALIAGWRLICIWTKYTVHTHITTTSNRVCVILVLHEEDADDDDYDDMLILCTHTHLFDTLHITHSAIYILERLLWCFCLPLRVWFRVLIESLHLAQRFNASECYRRESIIKQHASHRLRGFKYAQLCTGTRASIYWNIHQRCDDGGVRSAHCVQRSRVLVKYTIYTFCVLPKHKLQTLPSPTIVNIISIISVFFFFIVATWWRRCRDVEM